MSQRSIPAAAVPEGAEIIMPAENGGEPVNIHVVAIENSTPRPGQITWWSEDDMQYIVSGAQDVILVSLPDALIEKWNKEGARK